jgi:hypothetical protein
VSGSRRRWAAVAGAVVLALTCAACTSTGAAGSRAPAVGPAVSARPGAASAQPVIPSGQPYPPGRSLDAEAHVPRLGDVDERDPTAVAKAWATLAYSYDTGFDSTPHDAALRAARYLTDDLAAELRRTTPYAAPGAEWNIWAWHSAWTTVAIGMGNEPRPPDTAGTAYRQLVVRGTARAKGGWTGVGPHASVYLTLVRTVGVWRIAELRAYP